MALRTKNYEMFKFRADNRHRIEKSHVQKLVESISARNLLELRPICVNKDLEIVDGQHRFLAAQQLGLDIYYEIRDELTGSDIILMNVSKAWNHKDYLNYYVRNHYPEYEKLHKFCNENNMGLSVMLIILLGQSREGVHKFRSGQFVFDHSLVEGELSTCLKVINLIKKANGTSLYTTTGKFWKALVNVVRHPNFDEEKFFFNLERQTDRIRPKINSKDYFKMFADIHNWRNPVKILSSDEEDMSPLGKSF